MLPDESLEDFAVRFLDHFGPDLATVPVLHADHGGLADRAPAMPDAFS